MNSYQDMVKDFDIAIKAPRNSELRIRLIQEEADELLEAISDRDIVAVIDALCDLLYVTYGAAHVFGLELSYNNPSYPKVEEPRWDLMADPEVRDEFNEAVNDAIKSLRIFEHFTATGRLRAALQELADGCWDFGMGGAGVDLGPFFREVHRTNMHKLSGPQREDGKQLKPEGWKPPRLRAMYDRLRTGADPECPIDCLGDLAKDGENFDVLKTIPHFEGGRTCVRCGGFVVEVGT